MKLSKYSVWSLLILLSACGLNPADLTTPTTPPDAIETILEESPTLTPIPISTATLPPPIVVESAESVQESTTGGGAIEATIESTAEPEAIEIIEIEPTEESSNENEIVDEGVIETVEIEPVPLTILSPRPNDKIKTGQPFQLIGLITPGDNAPVQITLRSGISELATATLTANGDGNLVGDLQIPFSVEGSATLTATNGDEQVVVDVLLARDSESPIPGAVIDLNLPTADTVLVSGYMVFLAGSILDPIDNQMTIGLLMDNCSTFVSRHTISLTAFAGSWSSWNAQIVLPAQAQGEGCIVAYTGEYGVGEWREKHIPVLVVNEKDSRAKRVDIVDSFEGVLSQGDSIYLSGMAIDTETVELRLLRDGEEEIAFDSVAVGDFGFWEVDFTIPNDNAIGKMLLEVAVPGVDDGSDSFEFEVR